MPVTDLSIHIDAERIIISHPEKGKILNLSNLICLDEERKLVAIGPEKAEYEALLVSPLLKEVTTEKLFSHENISSRRGFACLDYLLGMSEMALYPKRASNPLAMLCSKFNLQLSITNYLHLSQDIRDKFEFEVVRWPKIREIQINGRNLIQIVKAARLVARIRLFFDFVMLVLFMAIVSILRIIVQHFREVDAATNSQIVYLVIFFIVTTIILFGYIVFREWSWFMIGKRLLPSAHLFLEINRSKDIPKWCKQWMINKI